jgi:hypothetical protein
MQGFALLSDVHHGRCIARSAWVGGDGASCQAHRGVLSPDQAFGEFIMRATNRVPAFRFLASSVCPVLLAAVSLAVPQFSAAAATAPVSVAPAPVYGAADTARFKALAKQTIVALDARKKSRMIAKLTDLETLWDEKETILSPKDPATWTIIDKTLDRAISALRSTRTDLAKGKAALQDFISKLDQATKH